MLASGACARPRVKTFGSHQQFHHHAQRSPLQSQLGHSNGRSKAHGCPVRTCAPSLALRRRRAVISCSTEASQQQVVIKGATLGEVCEVLVDRVLAVARDDTRCARLAKEQPPPPHLAACVMLHA